MSASPSVYILAAPLFDEQGVVTCLSEMRGQGIKTLLVATTPGLLSGKRGITLRPDTTLSQAEEFNIYERSIAIIAGGEESAAAVLSDPRAHELLNKIFDAGGFIGGMKHTCQFIESLNHLSVRDNSRFIWQRDEEIAEFIKRLVFRSTSG